MRKKIIMGNWKMNGSAASIVELLTNLKALQSQTPKADSVVFPPSIYIPLVQSHLTNTSIAWGAQNVYPKDQGGACDSCAELERADRTGTQDCRRGACLRPGYRGAGRRGA